MSRKLMQQALEALEFEASGWEDVPPITREAITALRQALSEQPAHQEVDWEKLYRLEVKKKDALAAKYERDIKPLTKIVLMTQPAQQQEPVISTDHGPWIPSKHPREEGETYCKRCLLRDKFFGSRQCDPHIVYTAPQKREWVGLTDEEVGTLTVFDGLHHVETPLLADFIRAIEAKLKERNG